MMLTSAPVNSLSRPLGHAHRSCLRLILLVHIPSHEHALHRIERWEALFLPHGLAVISHDFLEVNEHLSAALKDDHAGAEHQVEV